MSVLYNDVVARTNNAQLPHGRTPLHVAARAGHLRECQQLIELGAAVDPVDLLGWTPFGMAVAKGHADIVSLLIKNGANVNRRFP